MIKAEGNIPSNNGISIFTNPIINIFVSTDNKYSPTIAVAQVGKELTDETENKVSFESVENICTSQYQIKNPSFEAVQALLMADLQNKYPTVTFEVI